jgi:hypothetical protein
MHECNVTKHKTYYSSATLTGSSVTTYPMHISSSKIISHSLQSILVEGEYCLLTYNHLIRGEIALVASDKIRVALLFTKPPPQLLGGVDDEPRASFNEALLLVACTTPSPVLFDPLETD